MKKLLDVLAILAIVSFIAALIAMSVCEVRYNINCGQYIERAAEAPTVEIAKRELGKAIEYAKANGLTSGNTSLFVEQPCNDIGYWFSSLTAAYDELTIKEPTSSVAQTNLLMRLRETLVAETPTGIALHPNNTGYFWWTVLSVVTAVGLWLVPVLLPEEWYD